MTTAVVRGGRAIYGAPLGILMLEARFPRIPGDMGNATTWPFPVLYRVVRGATPARVVQQGARGLLPAFLEAAADLVAQGAEALTTNCGFLSLFQADIAAYTGVPVLTSSLMQVPWVQATLPPGRRVGLVTVDAASLSPAHLAAAGVPADTPVSGTEHGSEFHRILIRAESDDMDTALARQDVLDAGADLVRRHQGGRRHRARMHQHAPLRRRPRPRHRPPGARHRQPRVLVPRRASAPRVALLNAAIRWPTNCHDPVLETAPC